MVGWYCGCIKIIKVTKKVNQKSFSTTVTDGTSLSSIQGLPITGEWLDDTYFSIAPNNDHNFYNVDNFHYNNKNNDDGCEKIYLQSDAIAILVIEKEGVYTRLAEDRFFDYFPCILVTGKGFPDLATRAMISNLHKHFPELPILGICDCNPYGVAILQTFSCGSLKRKFDGGHRYTVPIQWVGLRPSHLLLNQKVKSDLLSLPAEAFQALTDLDHKKIMNLCNNCDSSTMLLDDDAKEELMEMSRLGFKVELEALHWLGMDCMSKWLQKTLSSILHFEK